MNTDERIAVLRQRILERKDSDAIEHLMQADVLTARSLRASEGVDSWTLRRGLLTRDRLSGQDIPARIYPHLSRAKRALRT